VTSDKQKNRWGRGALEAEGIVLARHSSLGIASGWEGNHVGGTHQAALDPVAPVAYLT
jgi:hypothetical protein